MGILFYVLVNLIVGVRLLWLARKTRQVPEGLLAACLLLSGALGWSLILTGSAVAAPYPPTEVPVDVLARAEKFSGPGTFFTNLGNLSMMVFVWRVYRPTSRLVPTLIALAALALLLATVHDTLLGGRTYPHPPNPVTWLGIVARVIVFPWSVVEAGAYYAKLRKQVALGLAEPVVANRVLLFSLGMLGSTLLSGLAVVTYGLGGGARGNAGLVPVYGALGLFTAVNNWLVFFPPAVYLRWVQRGAASAADEAARG